MSSRDRLLTRETFGDVLVNLVPLGVLAVFVGMVLVSDAYPMDPLYTTVQVSLIVVPGVVLLVLTYYALRAVDAAERDGGLDIAPGYTERDSGTSESTGDD